MEREFFCSFISVIYLTTDVEDSKDIKEQNKMNFIGVVLLARSYKSIAGSVNFLLLINSHFIRR